MLLQPLTELTIKNKADWPGPSSVYLKEDAYGCNGPMFKTYLGFPSQSRFILKCPRFQLIGLKRVIFVPLVIIQWPVL
jgi:hypothetical protein